MKSGKTILISGNTRACTLGEGSAASTDNLWHVGNRSAQVTKEPFYSRQMTGAWWVGIVRAGLLAITLTSGGALIGTVLEVTKCRDDANRIAKMFWKNTLGQRSAVEK